MSIDTRDKRFSMLGMATPVRREQQNPSGTIGAPARELLLFLYSGIALSPPGGTFFGTPLHAIRAGWGNL